MNEQSRPPEVRPEAAPRSQEPPTTRVHIHPEVQGETPGAQGEAPEVDVQGTTEAPVGRHLFGFMGVEVHSPATARQSQSGITITLAITGLVLWLVQTYIVNPVPFQVSAAVYTIVPSAVGWVATHVTFRRKVVL